MAIRGLTRTHEWVETACSPSIKRLKSQSFEQQEATRTLQQQVDEQARQINDLRSRVEELQQERSNELQEQVDSLKQQVDAILGKTGVGKEGAAGRNAKPVGTLDNGAGTDGDRPAVEVAWKPFCSFARLVGWA
eukprot:CAMPEP_0172661046 /NCGR_PEP_ID=MMETSP1074-20121228/4438_1 /TAXON_ID=2916 /ORGANISM="Ceratium fusus, Strain PA161109" /LENGTH=133 /DNA_ID=CAMNT_0013476753 /DNA_START=28 /DNA_END=425 /DNA_ORIENTATION=-